MRRTLLALRKMKNHKKQKSKKFNRTMPICFSFRCKQFYIRIFRSTSTVIFAGALVILCLTLNSHNNDRQSRDRSRSMIGNQTRRRGKSLDFRNSQETAMKSYSNISANVYCWTMIHHSVGRIKHKLFPVP